MDNLISKEYVEMNKILHAAKKSYGAGAGGHIQRVMNILKEHPCKSVLDYGCSKGTMGMASRRKGYLRTSDITWQNYDPAVEEFSKLPKPADLVIVRDVMEHVEPDKIDNVIAHVASLTNIIVWFVIPKKRSSATLENGLNAHLTQQPKEWWIKRLETHFEMISSRERDKSVDGIFKPNE